MGVQNRNGSGEGQPRRATILSMSISSTDSLWVERRRPKTLWRSAETKTGNVQESRGEPDSVFRLPTLQPVPWI